MSESPRNGVQTWGETMSARDRFRAIAETLREPRINVADRGTN